MPALNRRASGLVQRRTGDLRAGGTALTIARWGVTFGEAPPSRPLLPQVLETAGSRLTAGSRAGCSPEWELAATKDTR